MVIVNPIQHQNQEYGGAGAYDDDPYAEYGGLKLDIQADPALDLHTHQDQSSVQLASSASRHHESTQHEPQQISEYANVSIELAQPSAVPVNTPASSTLSPQQAAAAEGRQFGTMDVFAELDEWPVPSLEQAQIYSHQVHPRDKNKQGELVKFSWWKTSLGRHCSQGGCGEQCDGCGEGSASAFKEFGSGISNYFKFLKWLVQ